MSPSRRRVTPPALPARLVCLPEEVVSLFHCADSASSHLARLEGQWDSSTLPMFRDALDHLVDAAKHDERSQANATIAAEHLGLIALDIQQILIIAFVNRVQSLERWHSLRWSFRDIPDTKWVQDQLDLVAHCVAEGRKCKGGANPARWLHGIDCLQDALREVGVTETALADARRLRRPINVSLVAAVVGSLAAPGLAHIILAALGR